MRLDSNQPSVRAQHYYNLLARTHNPDSPTGKREVKYIYAGYGNFSNSNLRERFLSLREVDDPISKEDLPTAVTNSIRRFIKSSKLARARSYDPIAASERQIRLTRHMTRLENMLQLLRKKNVFRQLYLAAVTERMNQLTASNLAVRREAFRNKKLSELRRAITSRSFIAAEEARFRLDFVPIRSSIFLRLHHSGQWTVNVKLEVREGKRIGVELTVNNVHRQITIILKLKLEHIKYYKKLLRKKSPLETVLFFLNKLIYFKDKLSAYQSLTTLRGPTVHHKVSVITNPQKLRQIDAKLVFVIYLHLLEREKLDPRCGHLLPLKSTSDIRQQHLLPAAKQFQSYAYLNSTFTQLHSSAPRASDSSFFLDDFLRRCLEYSCLLLTLKSGANLFLISVEFAHTYEQGQLQLTVSALSLRGHSKAMEKLELRKALSESVFDGQLFIKNRTAFADEFANKASSVILESLTVTGAVLQHARPTEQHSWCYEDVKPSAPTSYTDFAKFQPGKYIKADLGADLSLQLRLRLVSMLVGVCFMLHSYE